MCGCFRDIDPDSVLAYNTPKIVRVKDRYLGLLRLTLLVIIAIYIVIKVLVIDEGYNISDTPIGSVRISLMKQHNSEADTTIPADENFCISSPEPWDYPAEKDISCQTWDEHGVRYPLEEVNGVFLTTRVVVSDQKLVCGADEQPCLMPWADETDPKPVTYFLAGVRAMTLGFKHNFYAPTFSKKDTKSKFSGSNNYFTGRLLDSTGKVVRVWEPTFDDTPDVITVGALLDASGVDLEAPSSDPKNSQLYAGAVIMVLVTYDNPGNGKVRYSYHARPIAGADYKLYEVRWNKDGDTAKRTSLKRAGPKFIFIVTGTLTKFSFQATLLQLVSAIGLLSLASLIVEMCMLHIMPLRMHYAKVKFDETEDFSDVRDQMKLDPHQQSSNVNDLNAALLDLRETGMYRGSDGAGGPAGSSVAARQ